MKKRKTVVASFLLAAVMGIGIGYAAVADVLEIDGKVQITEEEATEEFDLDVYFSAVTTGEGYTASIGATDNDKASFTVTGLDPATDGVKEVTITYTIKNESDRAAQVTVRPRTNYTEENDATGVTGRYLSADGSFVVTNSIGSGSIIIDPNGTGEVTFTIELIATPTKAIDESFIIELDATAVEATANA